MVSENFTIKLLRTTTILEGVRVVHTMGTGSVDVDVSSIFNLLADTPLIILVVRVTTTKVMPVHAVVVYGGSEVNLKILHVAPQVVHLPTLAHSSLPVLHQKEIKQELILLQEDSQEIMLLLLYDPEQVSKVASEPILLVSQIKPLFPVRGCLLNW